MPRIRDNRQRRATLLVYGIAGTIGGGVAGAVTAWGGSLLGVPERAAVLSLFALGAVVVGCMDLAGKWVRIPQFNRETPYDWLKPGPYKWASRNGAAIGFGAATRLGFWLWFVIPVGAFVSGEPLVGLAGWGLYGAVRTFGAGLIAAIERRGRVTQIEILRYASTARLAADVQLVCLGLFALGVAGV